MDLQQLSRDLIQAVSDFSQQYGTGSAADDLLILVVAAACLAVLLVLITLRRESSASATTFSSNERVTAVTGKIEKIERSLNEFRTEVVRSLEILKSDMGYLRDELSELHRVVAGDRSGGEGGSGGGFGGASFEIEPGSEGGGGAQFAGAASADHEASTAKTAEIDRGAFGLGVADDAEATEEIQVGGAVETQDEAAAVAAPAGLAERLIKTRTGLFQRVRSLFSKNTALDADTIEELEELLVSADLGTKMVAELMQQLRASLQAGEPISQEMLLQRLRSRIREILQRNSAKTGDPAGNLPERTPRATAEGPTVVMLVGVNGVGKTTTVAKLANRWRTQGARVMVAAADTFRAAAVEQLKEWGIRVGVPVISGPPNSKPATVVFDAMRAAQREKSDVLIIDTAGRLHTKSNLMQELEGVRNAISRHQAAAPHETFLVIDGSTGQNAVAQAREFNAAVPLSGLIVTKLDGTPKGGIVVAISDELAIPVRYIGIGEAAEDLRPFDAAEFSDALLDPTGVDSARSTQSVSAHGTVRRRRRADDPGSAFSIL